MKSFLLATTTLLAIAPAVASAAQSESIDGPAVTNDKKTTDQGYFDTIVVTGAATEMRKFDVSYSVTTWDEEQLLQLAPLNTADLIGRAPGVFAESTAGEGSSVTRLRGIPDEGRFQSYQEDGMTIYNQNRGTFYTGDGVYRNDIMTERFEIVRGGPAPIFASQAAAIYNAVTRQGTDTPEGAVRITTGDPALYRVDGYYAGPLAEDTYIALGGFYRYNSGLREHEFGGDQGGQFRVNIRHELDKGELRFFGKYFNDSNIFYQPVPLADPRDGSSIDQYFDTQNGTLYSNDLRGTVQKFQDEDGAIQSVNRDVADGRHTVYFNTGFEFDYEVAGWELTNKFRYTNGVVDFDALYSGRGLSVADEYIGARETDAFAAFDDAVSLGYAIAGTNGTQLYDPNADSGLVVQGQYRAIKNDFDSLANDFRATRGLSFFGDHEFTVGVHLSTSEAKFDRRHNEVLLQVLNEPRLLDIVAYDVDGDVAGYVTDNGVVGYSTTLNDAYAEMSRYAFYGADTWEVSENLTLDLGIRYERSIGDGYVTNTTTVDLGDETTLADDNTITHAGTITPTSYDEDYVAWTVGANYDFNQTLGLYARASKAVRGPEDDTLLFNQTPTLEEADQYEVGVKLSTETLSVFVTGFYSYFDPFNNRIQIFDETTGVTEFVNFSSVVESPGVEVDFVWQPAEFFTLQGAWTYNDVKLSDVRGADGTVVDGDGNQPVRQPKIYGNLQPSINLELGGWDTQIFARYTHIGERFVDLANTTAMPAFNNYGIGFTATKGPWVVQLVGDNITNELGVTEGNVRADTISGQGTAEVNYGRPNFGSNYQFSITRKF